MKKGNGRIKGLFLIVIATIAILAYAACGDDEQLCPSAGDCMGRECGPDPVCMTSCGACSIGEACSADGICMPDCVSNCAGRECGWDPVCGNMSCGTCPADRPNCNATTGTCSTDGPDCPADRDCAGRECGLDPICSVSCGTCSGGETCSSSGRCVCAPNCSGRECGLDPVCSVSCGTCSSPETCTPSGTCNCTRNCAGRECGPDPICGVSCGSCSAGSCTTTGTCTTCSSGATESCANLCGSAGTRSCSVSGEWGRCQGGTALVPVALTDDTYIDNDPPTVNHGTEEFVIIGKGVAADPRRLAFFRFDADLDTWRAEGATSIIQADLSVYVSDRLGSQLELYGLSNTTGGTCVWNEDTLTYYTQVTAGSTNCYPDPLGWVYPDISMIVDYSMGYVDITAYVQWLWDGAENDGFMLTNNSGSSTPFARLIINSTENSRDPPSVLVRVSCE